MGDTEVIGGFVSAAVTIFGGYALNRHNERIKKVEEAQTSVKDDLSFHKLESEKRYAKEETLQTSLSRIHDRIDTFQNKMDTKLDAIIQHLINKDKP